MECTFGILKGRWRILKTGIRVHGVEKRDQVLKTCCALRNISLEVNGIDDKTNWQGEWGWHNTVDDVLSNATPSPLLRLNSPAAI